ncbi:Protein lifeguard 3 [Oryzias melastigma]|uniref:Protein lifeguard 3 n=1 Tax=Oryzias melastigma TaxID=30732 RepID=A0A834F6X2_ORYME|nr:Protein lifeguard 3 [Oryzias melastigma]
MTSKANSPPSYEEALHHPKSEDCSYLPPPSYSPSPGMYPGPPGYWSQGGVFPQAGVSPGFSPSIPTLSAALPASHSGDMEEFFRNQWESTSVRHAFIRKVYLILAVQLSFTFTVVAVFTFVDPVRQFVIRYPGIYWASLAVYFVVYCVLICLKEPRRRFPWNLLLLGIFTLALSYMAGTISSYYETKAVFIAMGITAVVCVAVTVFCFQTKVDLTSCSGLLCISGVLLMIIGIVTAVVLSFQYVRLFCCDAFSLDTLLSGSLFPHSTGALASHALRCNRSGRLHSVSRLQHSAPHREPGAVHQPGGVRLRSAVALRGHRSHLPLHSSSQRIGHGVDEDS